ncbi:hypothetical protein [Salipiger abyssi]|uniref:hypothetical protein n=1 Tax=Salipiger abyssi TaxID=1250539 RepID=UPI001A8DAD42|nr:hypothetical protein [Salipiger abyssi]MBN9889379.1 hypothetical protein [Salipiger abyssi]
MKPDKPNLLSPEAYLPGGGVPNFKAVAGFVLAVLLELSMLILLASTYTETMGLASNQYLCDLPGAGGLFCIIDEDMTVSHLLAYLLAVFSISVPIMIWSAVLDEDIHEDPRSWLASPMNRVKAGVAGLVYAAVVALEATNLYTLIAQQSAPGPWAKPQDASPMMDFLAQNQGLGIFVALLIVLVNAVLALLTVRATRSLTKKD